MLPNQIEYSIEVASDSLVWSEEFDGTSLNEKLWNYELGDGCPNLCGWGNNEPQIYTKTNHTLKNGFLHIQIRKEDTAYTSTRITTEKKFEFQYGRVEARAKLPIGKGIWPAIWMLGSNHREVGWPLCGEIDILEYVGREPHIVFNSLHTKDSHGETINTKKTKIDDIEEGFHTYVADWSPKKIDFYVDGDLLYSFEPKVHTKEIWPFDQPFYLILNSAIGGNFGGHDIDDSVLPQEFVIDYVRVYKN
ncbi:glycoside hydrolase family 16 protein [Maribacter algarum]|uniref:Glycoside hydrolase family 16 protein n=1 Tax=Maribacter algarum (ex Zhang et al. 2020) TaxID=2578118 RepID=A0A5S3PZ20_9FLAO|nr:glycoside hydrolase family 16 protein [Maribacter algarum]TMM59532.1 glycoside hydrolase family 16 protein [Maribacter algarum]